MALKQSNKNRKKVEEIQKGKIKTINKEREVFQKDFIKYYSFVVGVVVILFLIL